MPTDMCALQDFDELDKLHIKVNDVITIIEGRWVTVARNCGDGERLVAVRWRARTFQGGELLVARAKQAHPEGGAVPQERGDVRLGAVGARHQQASEEQLHSHGSRRHQPASLLGLPRQDWRVRNSFHLKSVTFWMQKLFQKCLILWEKGNKYLTCNQQRALLHYIIIITPANWNKVSMLTLMIGLSLSFFQPVPGESHGSSGCSGSGPQRRSAHAAARTNQKWVKVAQREV